MGALILTWLTVIGFVMLVFWGMNIPTTRRSKGIMWIAAVVVLFNVIAQTYFFHSDTGIATGQPALRAADQAQAEFNIFLGKIALVPGGLQSAPLSEWYKIFSSSMIHYGWLHLIYNLWFFVLFGHVLEQTWGFKKLACVIAGGLIIPPILDGFVSMPGVEIVNHVGGFSGVVYAVMGAGMISFPRARCYAAVNYDLRYWAVVLFIIFPVTMITRYAGLALTEMVIVCGMLGSFLLIQPEHFRISIPVITIILYKLLQDVLLVQPVCGDIISNSPWRIMGGFAIGIAGGFIFNRTRGWQTTWPDETHTKKLRSGVRQRVPVAQMESAGHKDIDSARTFLGQRVFIGDAARAAQFYKDVVIPKFPDLALPMQEQAALARLLHFKGWDVEALHAYEILLGMKPLHDEYWLAWLKAAELIIKVAPERSIDADRYLNRFLQGNNILMRDRIEAERLLESIPESARSSPSEEESDADTASEANYSPGGPSRLPANDAADELPEVARRGKYRARPEAAVLDMPRHVPVSFRYVAGEMPVSLKQTPPTAVSDAGEEDSEPYWKPIPCVAKRKLSEESLLELRMKNPRIVEEGDKPEMYGGILTRTDSPSGTSGRGRLSRLELMRNDISSQVPEKSGSRGQYGGLDDHDASRDEMPKRFKLRGEKEEPPRRALRARYKASAEDKPAFPPEKRLPPSDKVPPPDDGYGAEPANG